MAYSYKDLYDLYKDDKKVDNVPQSGGAYTFDVLSDIYSAGVTDDNEDYASQLFDPKNVENYKAKQIESDAINQNSPPTPIMDEPTVEKPNEGFFSKLKNAIKKNPKKVLLTDPLSIKGAKDRVNYVKQTYNDQKKVIDHNDPEVYEAMTPYVLERMNFLNQEFQNMTFEERWAGFIPTIDPEKRKKRKEDHEYLQLISEEAEMYNKFLNRSDVKSGFFDGLKESILDLRFLPFGYNAIKGERDKVTKEAIEKLEEGERELLDIKTITDKYHGGDVLNKNEIAALNLMSAKMIDSRIDRGIPYAVGEMMPDMARYGYEFLITKGAAKGALGASKLGPAVNKVTKILPKRIAGPFMQKLTGELAESAVQTGINFPALSEKAAGYALPEYEIMMSEDGEALLKEASKGDDPTTALRKAFLSSWVEHFSERVGDLTTKGGSAAYKGIVKRMGLITENPEKFMQKALIGKAISKSSNKSIDFFSKYLKKSGFDGLLMEILEEEINEPVQAKIDGRKYYSPLTPEGAQRLMMEVIGIGMYGGLLKIPDKTVNAAYKWREKRPEFGPIDIPIDDEANIPPDRLPSVIQEELEALGEENSVDIDEGVVGENEIFNNGLEMNEEQMNEESQLDVNSTSEIAEGSPQDQNSLNQTGDGVITDEGIVGNKDENDSQEIVKPIESLQEASNVEGIEVLDTGQNMSKGIAVETEEKEVQPIADLTSTGNSLSGISKPSLMTSATEYAGTKLREFSSYLSDTTSTPSLESLKNDPSISLNMGSFIKDVKIKDLAQVYDNVGKITTSYIKTLEDLPGSPTYDISIKEPQSLLRKLATKRSNDTNYSISKINDVIRSRVVYSEEVEIESAVQKFRDAPYKKDYFTNPDAYGYRAFHIGLNINGVPAEIQFHTPKSKEIDEIIRPVFDATRGGEVNRVSEKLIDGTKRIADMIYSNRMSVKEGKREIKHLLTKYGKNKKKKISNEQYQALLGGERSNVPTSNREGDYQGDREEHSETEEQKKPEPVDRLQLKKDIMGELSFELSLGLENNPGKMRTGNGDTIDYKWYGARSFYPSWVPEHLHNRKAVEAVIDKLNSDNPKLIKLRKDSKAEEILNLYKAEAKKRYREKMYQLGYGAEEPTPTNPLEGIEDDIPLDLAVRAHEGTSYSPEKRGQSRVDEYIDIMKSDYALLKKYADTKEKVNQLNEMFERYREGYKKRTLDMLSSHSRIVSSMIAGPARFPTSTMRKRNDSYDNKVRESIEYRDKVLAKIKNTLNPTTSAVISQSDPDALVKLKERLKALEDWHEKMVQINKIIRSGKDIEQKLEKLELSEKIKDQILIKGGELNNGIPSYSLRNNKGKIKQVKDRITRLEKIKSIESTETPFDGGKILMNTGEARIQIFFDSKPDSATRDKLKKNAFRWSPMNQAWQRQLTMNAIRATEGLFNVSVKRGKVKPISTSVDASIGMYATDEEISLNFTPEEVAEKMLDHVPPSIQMPEMANIFRQLTEGNFIEIRNKMGNKLGYHKAGTIKMLGKLFIDEEQSTKILAHEIGHLIDYLPTKTTKRGNLLGRLATLNRYMKGKLINEEKQKKVESLVDERIKFQERRRNLKELKKKTNAGPKAYKAEDTQFLREIKRINKEIKELQKDAVYNKTVTAELKNLTMLWRPFDIDANESFTNYRFSAKELYADAISVLFVRPDILKAKAPTFLKTFLAFAYKKPKVFNSLLDSYTILYRGPEAIGKERSKKFMSMIGTGEDAYTAQIAEIQDSKTGLKFLMKYLLLDENQAVIDKVNELKKKGIHLSAEENPIHALESNNYIDAKVKAFLEKYILPVEKRLTKANVTWEQLGEILFLERVRDERGGLVTLIDVIEDRKPEIANLIIETLSHIQNMTVFEQYTYLENNLPEDYWKEIKSVLPAGIANPLGYTTTTAKQQLKYLKGFYSAEKWDQLMKAKEEFRLANKEIIRRAKDVGYYTPELIEKMESNDSYATFQVIEYLDLYVSPAVRGQKGTFKDIANPAISTIMKNISIITAIERNETKKKIIGMLLKHFPKDIEKARTKWTGKGHMILDTKEVGKGTIKLVVNGKLEGFNVDKYIANTVNIMNNDTLVKMGALLSIPNKFYRPVFTSLNLGFQSFNFVRDFVRYWKNVPDDSLAGALTSLPRAFYRYAQAAPSAWGRASNKPDKLIAEMDELGILGVTWNDMFNNPDKADVQIDRILVKADLKAINPRKKQKLFIRPFAKVLNTVETLGNFIETLPKVAGYIELKGKMPDAELARFLRTRVGSPDFRRKGAATPVTNNLFLFSNAIKEGWRADLASATDPKTRAGWAWKTMLVSLMPKLLMFLIAKGWLGEELEKMMNDASEYDKTNYVMIPLGRAKNGKTEFLRIPQDETGRFLGGLFWKGLNGATDDDINLQDLFNILDYGAGQFPSVSPIFTGAGATISYLSGRNPYDSFRGRYVIPDDEFDAGPKYSAPIFLEWLIQNQGAGMVLPNINALRDVEITNLEKVINAPILANTLGRWIKVTDQGRREAEYEPVLDERKTKAVEKIEKEKSLEGYVAQFLETDRSESEMNYYIKLFTEEQIGPGPYKGTAKTQATNLKKSFMKEYFYRTGEKQLSTLKSLGSNAEKRAYINSVKYNMTEEEFEVFLNEALKAKFISENVYNEF